MYVPYETPQADSLRSPRAARMRSMSRALFLVLMCWSSSSPLRAQASDIRRAVAMFPVTDPSGAGQGRSLVTARSAWPMSQLTGVEGALPRGAKPMRS